MQHCSHIPKIEIVISSEFLVYHLLKKKRLMSSLYLNFIFKVPPVSLPCVCEVTTVSSAPTSRANAALLTSGTILIHLLKTATWDKPTSPALGLYTRTHTPPPYVQNNLKLFLGVNYEQLFLPGLSSANNFLSQALNPVTDVSFDVISFQISPLHRPLLCLQLQEDGVQHV